MGLSTREEDEGAEGPGGRGAGKGGEARGKEGKGTKAYNRKEVTRGVDPHSDAPTPARPKHTHTLTS